MNSFNEIIVLLIAIIKLHDILLKYKITKISYTEQLQKSKSKAVKVRRISKKRKKH